MKEQGTKKRRRAGLTGLAALVLVLSLMACSVTGCAPRQEEPDDGRMKVVTTIFPPYDFARAISGNGELAYVHGKCEKCGKVVHIERRSVEAAMQSLSGSEGSGFELDCTRTLFYGICGDCRRHK